MACAIGSNNIELTNVDPPRAIRHSEQSEPDGTKFAQRKDETVTVLILVALRVAIA